MTAIRVEGVRKAHLGPRMDFAKVEFVVEPGEDLMVVFQVAGLEASREHLEFLEWAVYGFLDVVMLAGTYPMRKMKITVVGAEVDPIESSAMAFRLAGRDAGRGFLEEIRAAPRRM